MSPRIWPVPFRGRPVCLPSSDRSRFASRSRRLKGANRRELRADGADELGVLDSASTTLPHKLNVEGSRRFSAPTPLRYGSALECRSGKRKGRDVITLKHRPSFEISESKDGGYLVLVTWPKGSEQQVEGFASIEAVRSWIETTAQTGSLQPLLIES